MSSMGSWEPVTLDAYYQAKRDAGLIGSVEEYATTKDYEAAESYLNAQLDARG